LAEQAQALAVRAEKPGLQVDVVANRLRLPAKDWERFWSAFVHVLRNAIDHGIETPAERARVGKPLHGRIALETRMDGDDLVIELADDGRGVDWDAVRSRARALGLACATRADLMKALFTDGVSTSKSATALSGRGVGMAAIRAVCDELGATISVDSELGVGTVVSVRCRREPAPKSRAVSLAPSSVEARSSDARVAVLQPSMG
jgi:sensor histidine kinase regulating citrate/malate metabolism